MNMTEQFIQARENAGHTQIQASVEIPCGLSTVQLLEKGTEPKTAGTRANVVRYIKKHEPTGRKK